MELNRELRELKHVLDQFFGVNEIKFATNDHESRLVEYGAKENFRQGFTRMLKENKVILCGGAITSIINGFPVNDLDFYCKDNNVNNVIELFKKYFPIVKFTSNNAVTLQRGSSLSRKMWTVQIITRFTGDPQKIFDDFDFTCVQGAYDFERERFEFGERFFLDNAKKRLVYCGKSNYPICAMYRTLKYQKRGYTIPGSTVMHIALSIVRLKINTYRDLKDQLMGIDTSYLQGLLESDKYADALPVDYGKFLQDAFNSIDGASYKEEEEWEKEDIFQPSNIVE